MRSPKRRRAAWAYVLCVLLGSASVSARAQELDPLRIRNLSPLIAIFGLPTWEGAGATHRTEVAVVSELANHYRLSRRGDDVLVLDGETWRTGVSLSRRVNERWSLGLEVPLYQHSGGWLDDLIDGWHRALRLPDGGRNNRAEGLLHFQLSDRNGTHILLDGRSRGLGDIQLKVSRLLGEGSGVVLQATVKLATGDQDGLTGSGATDVAVTVLTQRPLTWRGRPAGLYWGMGVIAPGEPKRFTYPREEVVYLGLLGASWRPWLRVGLKAQLDLHSPFYDSPLEELGQTSAQGTVGAWWTFGAGRRLEFAVSEDLHVSTSPDVALHVGLRWGL